jgi:hypothetical protein
MKKSGNMVGLFLIYLIALGFTVGGKSKVALYMTLIAIGLSLVMFYHHVTDPLNLRF